MKIETVSSTTASVAVFPTELVLLGVIPDADKVAAVTNMLVPINVKQLHSLLGVFSHNTTEKLWRAYAYKCTAYQRSANGAQGVNFIFTPAIETIIRQLLHDLATPLISIVSG